MPSIIFLGTAGDEYTAGKQIRASGGIIIQVEGYQFHLDPGPGALVRAQQAGVNLRENTAVLVSHAHINHCNDANAVMGAMSHNGFDVNGVLISNMTFVNGDENAKMAPVLTDFHRNCVERIIVAKAGQRIGIESVEIQTLNAFHKDPHALGFKFITPKFTLTYSGDTGYNKELIEQYRKSDILVLNMVYPSGAKEKDEYNLTFEDAVKIIEKTKPKLVVMTHFGKKMLDADPLNEARDLQRASGVQVIAAMDGMSINPATYSADAKQRTLGAFKESSIVQPEEPAEEAPAEEETPSPEEAPLDEPMSEESHEEPEQEHQEQQSTLVDEEETREEE
jgi:ribonuclease BN (tRNA processing enzyme)